MSEGRQMATEVPTKESLGTAYDSFDHMLRELEQAVQPYRALLKHELKSVATDRRWWEQLTGAWEYAQAYRCRHAYREPVKWTLANGVVRVALQCAACGEKQSNGVRKADYPDDLPVLDEALVDEARTAFSGFYEQLVAIHTEAGAEYRRRQQHERSSEWWARYSAYLETPQWKSKRARVLERDGYVCQACLRREATQAHHLTYERVFNEPAFDLIAVCDACHGALHPHMEASNGQAA